MSRKCNTEQFIKKCQKVHGDKYDYSQVSYVDSNTPVCIICKEHGSFMQRPNKHLVGHGCPVCADISRQNKRRHTTEFFVNKAREVHGDKYDYSLVEYTTDDTKVPIICSEHGVFWQTPNKHLNNRGCPKCGRERTRLASLKDKEWFVAKANEVHNNKYTYEHLVYTNTHDKMTITCPTHGDFEQSGDAHLAGHGCPKCGNNLSVFQKDITKFIENLGFEIECDKKKILKGRQELDVYIESEKIAIEQDGIYWHSEAVGKNEKYHLSKTETCAEKGIKLIHIFEDEYRARKDSVRDRLKHILHKRQGLTRFGGRDCYIATITSDIAKPFLQKYNTEWDKDADIFYGAYTKGLNILVGVMSFKKNGEKYELTNFATDHKYLCPGVGGKLFASFTRDYNPNEVISYADRRWTTDKDNNLFTSIGFRYTETTPPDYFYCFEYKRHPKTDFTKDKLIEKYGLIESMCHDEMLKEIKAYKIWDCGQFKYLWTNPRLESQDK